MLWLVKVMEFIWNSVITYNWSICWYLQDRKISASHQSVSTNSLCEWASICAKQSIFLLRRNLSYFVIPAHNFVGLIYRSVIHSFGKFILEKGFFCFRLCSTVMRDEIPIRKLNYISSKNSIMKQGCFKTSIKLAKCFLLNFWSPIKSFLHKLYTFLNKLARLTNKRFMLMYLHQDQDFNCTSWWAWIKHPQWHPQHPHETYNMIQMKRKTERRM